MSTLSAIDIIVPVYKNATLTKICIDSILDNMQEIARFSPRIIIINDSPDDEEVSLLLNAYIDKNSDILLLVNDRNIGFVKSVNRGLKLAINENRSVILVNSDTVTFQGTLNELIEASQLDPQIGFACPRSNNAAIATFPGIPNSMSGIAVLPETTYENWNNLKKYLPRITYAPTSVGFYMYISISVLQNFKGLNEEFGVGYEEENDLVMRASKVGYRAVLANHSFAYHAGSASFSLTSLNLHDHQNNNLQKINIIHPEFIPTVRIYEASADARAQYLIKNLLPDDSGKYKIIFNCQKLGMHRNGTNELAINLIKSVANNSLSKFKIYLLCDHDVFAYHNFVNINNVYQIDKISSDYAVAIDFGQPFDMHDINVLETLAPINIFGMLDVIAFDCAYLSVNQELERLWSHVAENINGIFFISDFSEKTFNNRFSSINKNFISYTKLLPTQRKCYSKKYNNALNSREHILVMGNHFAHKNSEQTAEYIAKKFPNASVVCLGSKNANHMNLAYYKSGEIPEIKMDELLQNASVIVLPSFYEGFGFSFMHAAALEKPIIARNIPATKEILATFEKANGVYLYDKNEDLDSFIPLAIKDKKSDILESSAVDWVKWSEGFENFIHSLIHQETTYKLLFNRIRNGDLLREHFSLKQLLSRKDETSIVNSSVMTNKTTVTIEDLLNLSGINFIQEAYRKILWRECDPDGLKNYSAMLNSGVSKQNILKEISNSKEAALLAIHQNKPWYSKLLFNMRFRKS